MREYGKLYYMCHTQYFREFHNLISDHKNFYRGNKRIVKWCIYYAERECVPVLEGGWTPWASGPLLYKGIHSAVQTPPLNPTSTISLTLNKGSIGPGVQPPSNTGIAIGESVN